MSAEDEYRPYARTRSSGLRLRGAVPRQTKARETLLKMSSRLLSPITIYISRRHEKVGFAVRLWSGRRDPLTPDEVPSGGGRI